MIKVVNMVRPIDHYFDILNRWAIFTTFLLLCDLFDRC